MRYLTVLAIFFLSISAFPCDGPNWATGDFDEKLNSKTISEFKSYFDKTPRFLFARIENIAKLKNGTSLILSPIYLFKGREKNWPTRIHFSHFNANIQEGERIVIALDKNLKHNSKDSCGKWGFPYRQASLAFEFEQLAKFRPATGPDAWHTCQKDSDCTFVKGSSCLESINILFLTEYFNWHNSSKTFSKNTCDRETQAKKYRPKCLDIKICDKALR